jgi:hypothetical protein
MAIAGFRATVGTACLLAPGLAKLWVGRSSITPGAKILSRSLAARDVALGLGTGIAEPISLPKWVALSAVCDAVDALGTFAGHKAIGGWRRSLVTAVSAGSAIAGLTAAAKLRS